MPQTYRVDPSSGAEPLSWLEMDDLRVHRLLARLQSSNRALDELRETLEAAEPVPSGEVEAPTAV